MKIIKVVHSVTSKELAASKEQFILQSYTPDAFIDTHGDYVLERAYTTLSLKLMHGLIESASDEAEIKAAIRPALLRTVEALLEDLRKSSEQVEILPFQQAQEQYPQTRNLAVGTYTIHPRNSAMLTRIEHYHQNLALEKDEELIVLLGEMGAKEVTIIENDMRQRSGGSKGNVEKVVVNVGISFNAAQRIEQGKELKVTFEGHTPDIHPGLLDNSLWFSRDGQLSAMLRSRLSDNPMTRYELRNTYTETFDFDFDLAVRYLVLKPNLRAEYQTLSQTERLFIVEFSK
jgi:phosphoglycerate-specific signal transduction histidine kinase